MATSAWNKYQDFTEQLIRGVHDWDAHVFKVALTNTAPTATHASLSQIGEIAADAGYTAGGNASTSPLPRLPLPGRLPPCGAPTAPTCRRVRILSPGSWPRWNTPASCRPR